MYYFDYAATTPTCERANQAILSQLEQGWGNPSAQYHLGNQVAQQVKQWKEIIGGALGCDPRHFFFTSCGTESNNWAITQGVKCGKRWGKHCITSQLEHSSVGNVFKMLEQQGYEVTYLKPNSSGTIAISQVLEVLREDTVFLSLMLVNNETGAILPVEDVAGEVKKRNPHTLVHCDGVQAFLKVPFVMESTAIYTPLDTSPSLEYDRLLNIDLLSLSAHKVYGPKGIGGLYIRKGLTLAPLLQGGGQEQGLRSGTEATHQMAGFVAAVEEGVATVNQRRSIMAQRKQELIQGLQGKLWVKLHDFMEEPIAPHILSFSLVGYPSQVVLRCLSQQEIYVSAGSACHRGGESPVFSAMPLSKKERMGSLRVSFSHLTTEEDIQVLLSALEQVTTQLVPSY